MIKQEHTLKAEMLFPLKQHFWRAVSFYIADLNGASIIAVDNRERIIVFNKHAEQTFARPARTVLGQPFRKTFPSLAEHEYYLLVTLHQGRELKDVETYYCPYTNQRGVFSHSTVLIKDNLGSKIGAVWLRKNLTCKRRFQQEMSNAAVGAMVSQLAAGAAHEIRNPLTTAKGYLQLAQQKATAEVAEYLKIALEEIDQIDGIITQMLSLYYPKTEGFHFVSLNDMIKELIFLAQNSGNLPLITTELNLDDNIPLCLIDEKMIKHALLNILRNAIEAMPQGGTLDISTRYLPDSEEICITLKDTGVGISKENLSQIFKPFFTTKRSSGLGLTLTNRIIQHHSGRIEVESTVGRGTLIRLYLPILPP